MAFYLVAGAINGDITVTGLNQDSVQGDRFIMEILSRAGAEITYSKDAVTVKKSKLKAFTFDAESCPDLVPISAVLAAYADGVSVIKNIQRLKIKESDRVQTTIETLKGFGIKAESDGNDLIVYGGTATCGKADGFNDHRIVMSASVLACGVNGESVVTGAQAVNKSYPTFFKDFNKVGANSYEL